MTHPLPATTRTPSTSTHGALADDTMRQDTREVLRRLGVIFGSKMADMYQRSHLGTMLEEWALGLQGMSPAEIHQGLSACAARRFVPTLGEFAQLCRPALDPDLAWHEASAGLVERESGAMGDWSHPAVYRAAMAMYAEVRAGNQRACRARWELTLRQAFEQGIGDGVPAAPKRLANNASLTKMSPDFRARLRGLGFRVGVAA